MKEVQWLLVEKYKGKRTKDAEKDIARLGKGEHVDYVIGWVDFLDCKIDLSQRPLIPRPETEYWAKKFIVSTRPYPNSAQAASPRFIQVLDIFAGSGCVGIAVLKYIPRAKVDFAEKELTFLKQIEINAQLNGIAKNRYRVLPSDIFSEVKDSYDYIVANPPYVAEARKGNVQQSVLENEPHGAVFAGKDGLQYIRPFLQQAKKYLKDRGEVWMEFDSPQKSEIEEFLRTNRYSHWEFHRDQYGKWRYCVVRK